MGLKVAGHRRDAWVLELEVLVGCRVLVDFFYVKSFDGSRRGRWKSRPKGSGWFNCPKG